MSMIPATDAGIDWLFNRLYEASRTLALDGVHNPTFVLTTKHNLERVLVEARFYKYFAERFGNEYLKHINILTGQPTHSAYRFPGIHATVVLIDLEQEAA